MVNKEAATSRFLLDAATLLADVCPQVSAQLNATRRDTEQNPTPTHQACNACGTLLVPGWNCKIVKDDAASRPRRSRQDRLAGKNVTKVLNLQCSSCNSITRIESQKPQSSRSRSVKPRGTIDTSRIPKDLATEQRHEVPVETAAPPAPASTVEAGVKKRSRNKKSSLQSLLAGHKPAESKKGFGLDLMDFMKG